MPSGRGAHEIGCRALLSVRKDRAAGSAARSCRDQQPRGQAISARRGACIHNLLLLTGDDPRPATSPTPSRCSTSIRRLLTAMRGSCMIKVSCRPAARLPPGGLSFSAPPTCRSTRRRLGAERNSPPR